MHAATRFEKILLPLLVAGALAARLALAHAFPQGPFSNDAIRYAARAREIATAFSFGSPAPTAWETPGYPFFMALLGAWKPGGTGLLFVVQSLFGAVTACLAWFVARRVLPAAWSLGVAAMVAFSPNFVCMDITPMTESLGTVLFWAILVTAILVLDGRLRSPAASRWVGVIGVALGLASLVRATYVYLPVFLLGLAVLYAGWERYRKGPSSPPAWALVRQPLLLVVVTLATVAPWSVRNTLQMKTFILISSNGPEVFWCANNPIGYLESLDLFPGNQLPEVERAAMAGRLAWDYIRQDPPAALRRCGARFFHLLGRYPYGPIALSRQAPSFGGSPVRQRVDALSLWIWSYWAVGCWLILLRRPLLPDEFGIRLLAACIAYWLVFHTFIWSQPRLRHPMEPALLIVATLGWQNLFHLARRLDEQLGWTRSASAPTNP